jgi:hypothetical protein
MTWTAYVIRKGGGQMAPCSASTPHLLIMLLEREYDLSKVDTVLFKNLEANR